MENASKALIIAGEVLIGVLILSLASYMIIQFGNYSRNVNSQISEAEIRQFNVHFTNFSGRANISAQDVASLINYANKSNSDYEAQPGDDFYVDVLIDGSSMLRPDVNINSFLNSNRNTTYYYCNLTAFNVEDINDDTREITIKANDTDADITYNEGTSLVTRINLHPITDSDYANALLNGYNTIRKN